MIVPSTFLCKYLGFSSSQLLLFSKTCPYRYKKYTISKKNGGTREIAQPARSLKIMQKLLLNDYLMEKMPVHECATAYKKNHSILDNSKPHLNNQYLLKLDFSNFFSSIKATDFKQYLITRQILSIEDKSELDLVSNIFFMGHKDNPTNLVLSIGAPTSPHISNALMYDFDEKISKISHDNHIAYTRYSDDLTFSTNEKGILLKWCDIVKQELQKLDFPKLTLNHEKIVFSSKKHNRHITGVTVSNEGKASLGRSRKREIKSTVFNIEKEKTSLKELEKIKGLLAFAKMIEPDFFSKIREKYPEQMKIIYPKLPEKTY